MLRRVFVLAALATVLWAVGHTSTQAQPVTSLSSHKTAMVIVIEENNDKSFAVLWTDLFEVLTHLLAAPLDLIEMDQKLKDVINGVPGVSDFVFGLIRQGVLSMLDLVIDSAKADLGGSIQSCFSELLRTLTLEGLVYGPDMGKAFFDRYGEESIGNCLRDMAMPYYDKVVVLTDQAASFANFKQSLEDLNSQGYLIDLFLDLHSCGARPYTMNNRDCPAELPAPVLKFANYEFKTPQDLLQIHGGQPMNLNAVYMTFCGGSDFNATWRQLGVRASNGANELNYYVLFSPFVFMHYFTKGSLTLDGAANLAYQKERLLFNGQSYIITIDLTWVPFCNNCIWTFDLNLKYGSLMNQWLSEIGYGKDKKKPVNNVASSKRFTAGDGNIQRAELAPPPTPALLPPPPPAPQLGINSLTPTSGGPGQEVTMQGVAFHASNPLPLAPPASQVLFDGNPVATSFISTTELKFTVPAGAACGPHDVQVRNPTFAKGAGTVSNTKTWTLLCLAPPPGFVVLPGITSLSPTSGPAGTVVTINGSGFNSTTEVLFDGNAMTTEFVDSTSLRFTVPLDATCGERVVKVRRPGSPESNTKTFTVITPCHGGTMPPPPPPGPPPPPPPPSGGTTPSLKSFDTNNNDVIDDGEFFAVIDAWIAAQIDDPMFFEAIDLWISQSLISSARISSHPLTLQRVLHFGDRTIHTITFVAQGQGVASMSVEIYDLRGARIFDQEIAGIQLTWRLNTDRGEPAANGVYLYRILVHGVDGNVLCSEVQRIAVLR